MDDGVVLGGAELEIDVPGSHSLSMRRFFVLKTVACSLCSSSSFLAVTLARPAVPVGCVDGPATVIDPDVLLQRQMLHARLVSTVHDFSESKVHWHTSHKVVLVRPHVLIGHELAELPRFPFIGSGAHSPQNDRAAHQDGGGEGRSRRRLTDPGRDECEMSEQMFILVAAADVQYGVSMRREFRSHLEKIAPECNFVELIARDLVFHIEVIKDFYEPFLSDDGWKEFADAANIQEGDFVVFVYRGNFYFNSHICNSSGHEKSLTLSDHDVMNGHKANDQPSMNLEDGSAPLSNHVGGPLQHSYILAEQATLPTQMKKRVEEKVQAIQSNFPIYVKEMTEMCIIGSERKGEESRIHPLTFCRECSAWLPFYKTTIDLEVEGEKSWPTKFHARRGVSASWIYRGWEEFVRDNGLKVGDVCLFEAKKKYGQKLMVHVIRSEIEV